MPKIVQFKDNNGDKIYPKIKKDIMTAYTLGRPVLNIPSAYTNVKVPLDSAISVGTKLSFDNTNDRIIVGAGVSKIMISAVLTIYTSPNFIDAGLSVHKNEEIAAEVASSKTSTLTSITMASRIVEVNQGDYIGLYWFSEATGNYTVLGDSIQTYITIEVVE